MIRALSAVREKSFRAGQVLEWHPHLDYIVHPVLVVDPFGPFCGCEDLEVPAWVPGSSNRTVIVLDHFGKLRGINPRELFELGSW